MRVCNSMCVYVCHACICTYICYALVSIYMHICIHAYGSICARTCMCIFFSENAQCALLTPAQSWRLPDGTVCQFSKEGKEKERYLCNNFEQCLCLYRHLPIKFSGGYTCGKIGMRRLLASLVECPGGATAFKRPLRNDNLRDCIPQSRWL